jgi:hypothetical protein
VFQRLVARVRGETAAIAPAAAAGPIPAKRLAKATIAKGYVDPGSRPGMKRVVVTVEEATFKRIRARALKQDKSFASVVRELIEAGERATDKAVAS